MTIRNLILLGLLSCGTAARANVYSNYVNQVIPDHDANGLVNTIVVSDFAPLNLISNVSVELNVTGGWNGDLYAYLVHNNTTTAILLNRLGMNGAGEGYGNTGLNVMLTDQASGQAVTNDVHQYNLVGNNPSFNGGGQLTGTWQPDGRNVDPSLVLDTDVRGALLGVFDNEDPNGAWTIFFADMSGGYEGVLDNWVVHIDVVPEPTTWTLCLLGAGLALWKRARGGRHGS